MSVIPPSLLLQANRAKLGLQDFTCVTPTAVSKVGLVRF